MQSTFLNPTISRNGADGRVPPADLFFQCKSRTSQNSVNQLLLYREQRIMSHFKFVLNFNTGKLLLYIMHGLFILPTFLNFLKKSIPLTLLFLIDFAVELLVFWIFRCIFKGAFQSLSSVKQITNRRMIVHQCRLFWCEPSWPTIIDRTTHITSCTH